MKYKFIDYQSIIMKEYIWLKPHHEYAYVKGNTCKLPAKVAGGLVKGGFIKEFEKPKAPKKEKATK